MPIFHRTQHFTDDRVAPQRVRRRIANWSNYQTPGGLWLPTGSTDPSESTGVPPDWKGNYDFKFQKLDGPLQYFAGDTTDPDNTTLVGIRSSNKPQFWLNFKALGVHQGTPWQKVQGQQAIKWDNLWQNSDLFWGVVRHKLVKKIRLNQWPHPVEFRFAMRIPPRMTYEVIDNQIILRNESNGNDLMRSQVPYVEDANGDIFPAHLEEDGTAGRFPSFRIFIITEELQDAVHPLLLDPTTPITGTSDIDDCFSHYFSSHQLRNYGVSTSGVRFGAFGATDIRGVGRVASSAIPAGTLTAVRGYFYHANEFGAPAGITMYYQVAANLWVEGTGNGTIGVPGAMNFVYCQHDTLAWAGGTNGGTVIGTDLEDAETLYPFLGHADWTVGNNYGIYPFENLGKWEAWRDGAVNNGFTPHANLLNSQPTNSTEDLTNPLYFEIDWVPSGPAGFPTHFFMRRR